MKLDTERPFPLNALPREIGKYSVGLGIYFTTLILFGILLILLCVDGFILTMLNIFANNFAKELCIHTIEGDNHTFTVILSNYLNLNNQLDM